MVWYAFIAHIFSTKIIALNNALISFKHKNTALLIKQFHKYNKKKNHQYNSKWAWIITKTIFTYTLKQYFI